MLVNLAFRDTAIGDAVINVWYSICEGISSLIQHIYSFLPDNPFPDIAVDSQVVEVLHYMNYFLPVKQFIFVMVAWLVAIIGIIAYKLIFAFFKLIGG